jgi:hypothetical protein
MDDKNEHKNDINIGEGRWSMRVMDGFGCFCGSSCCGVALSGKHVNRSWERI